MVTLADSIDRAGFQSRYARLFNEMVAVNSVAPDWLFTHRRTGKSSTSVYVPWRSRANLLEAKRETARGGTSRTLFIVMKQPQSERNRTELTPFEYIIDPFAIRIARRSGRSVMKAVRSFVIELVAPESTIQTLAWDGREEVETLATPAVS